jgi:hypothetical protein
MTKAVKVLKGFQLATLPSELWLTYLFYPEAQKLKWAYTKDIID